MTLETFSELGPGGTTASRRKRAVHGRPSEDSPQPVLDHAALAGNPLVAAANRLLNLVPRIRATSEVRDAVALRNKFVDEVRAFEQNALAANVSREEVIGARYCLCTVIDEAAAQTPWGSQDVWGRHSLLVTFHNETWGGEKFYQLLVRLTQNPERHRTLIELLYYCNALGYEGKFRVVDNGYSQLEILRRRIATLLDNTGGGVDSRLSPHWQGVASGEAAWRMVPPWVVTTICAFFAFLLYLWFTFALGPQSDVLFARLAALELPRTELVEFEPASQAPRLRRFLEAEIHAGLLEVHDLSDRSVVTLLGDGLFESGRAEIKSRYLPVLGRVAAALEEVHGAVVVSGYTDSVPMRSVRFPSNWHLSEARADSVGALLIGFLADKSRIRTEGRGEADPVASNDLAEGRARNRRVEITLTVPSAEIHRQLNPSQVPAANARAGGRP